MKDIEKIKKEAEIIYNDFIGRLNLYDVDTEGFERYKNAIIPLIESVVEETRKQTMEEVKEMINKIKKREEHSCDDKECSCYGGENITGYYIRKKDLEELKKKLSKLDEVKG